jgi:hypothetical protein
VNINPRAGNLADLRVRRPFGVAAGFKLVGTLFARLTLEKQRYAGVRRFARTQ